MKIKKIIKQRFWLSIILTISGSLLATVLGANTFWSVIVGLVLANTVNVWVFVREPSRNAGAGNNDS